MPERQQAIEFQQYSPEEQVEIYWYAVRSVEPPATQFADFLAANRRKVLPPLLAKLRQEKNDMVKYYLMNVLSTMHTDHCTLKNDAEVIETIKSTIATVRDSRIRKLCETSLKTILEQPAAGGPC